MIEILFLGSTQTIIPYCNIVALWAPIPGPNGTICLMVHSLLSFISSCISAPCLNDGSSTQMISFLVFAYEKILFPTRFIFFFCVWIC